MKNKIIIDQSRIDNWLDNPVTKKLLSLLEELDEHLKEQMMNPEVFLHADSRVGMARLYGTREIIERIINLDVLIDDLIEKEEERDE